MNMKIPFDIELLKKKAAAKLSAFRESYEKTKESFVVSLDIGSSSVKLLKFETTGGVFRLIEKRHTEIASRDKEDVDENDIVMTLRSMLEGVDRKSTKFYVSLNCPMTCLRNITTPRMPASELEEAVRLNAKEQFPFSLDDALIDYKKTGEINDGQMQLFRLIVGASPRITVDRMLAILRKAAIEPESLVPVHDALESLEGIMLPSDQTTCFVDIGDKYTEMMLADKKGSIFFRKIPLSGSDLTKSLMGVLASKEGKTGLNRKEAEDHKLRVGIPAEGEVEDSSTKLSHFQILSMLMSPLEQLASEIGRGLDYYQEEAKGTQIGRLLLFGGGAYLKGLPEFLSRELGVEVKLAEGSMLKDFEGKAALEDELSLYGVALGMVINREKSINLLPEEIKEKKKLNVKRLAVNSAILLVAVTVLLGYLGMRIGLERHEGHIRHVGKKLGRILPNLKDYEKQKLTHAELRDEPYWEDVFMEISNILPENVHITEFSLKDQKLWLKGLIRMKPGSPKVSDLVLKLEGGLFNKVRLIRTDELPNSSNRQQFELSLWVDAI